MQRCLTRAPTIVKTFERRDEECRSTVRNHDGKKSTQSRSERYHSHGQRGECSSCSQSRLEREEVKLRPVRLVERHEIIEFDLQDEHLLACSGSEFETTTMLDDVGGHIGPSDHVQSVHGDNLAASTGGDNLELNTVTEKVDLGEIVSPMFTEKKWSEDYLPECSPILACEDVQPWSSCGHGRCLEEKTHCRCRHRRVAGL